MPVLYVVATLRRDHLDGGFSRRSDADRCTRTAHTAAVLIS